MAIKKTILILLLLVLPVRALQAQWRNDVAELFNKGRDYKAISEYLLQNFNKLETVIDKADAAGILAYCFSRLNDSGRETSWIVEYFDSFGAKDSGFAFLDLLSQADLIGWLNTWKSRYPFISEIALIKGIGDQIIMPAGILPLAIEITNEAYYKFSSRTRLLEAGQFKSGFNVIALDANELFISSGKRTYLLEVKSGALVLNKEIALEVEVSSPWKAAPKTGPQTTRPIEYKLSIYVGGELVMSSQKAEYPLAWKLDVQPSNTPYGFSPDYYAKRNEPNPMMNSIPIFEAIAAIYSLLKDLLKKRDKKEVEPPKIQTVQDLSLVFKQRDEYGRNQEMKISLKLRTKNLPYVLSVP